MGNYIKVLNRHINKKDVDVFRKAMAYLFLEQLGILDRDFFKAIHVIDSMIASTKGVRWGGACTDLDVMVVTAKSWQVPRVGVTSRICFSLIIFISMYIATHSKQFWAVYNIKTVKK